MAFNGLRVVSLESRRSREIEKLIRGQHGEPFIAPSMREVPLEDNPKVFEFAERLFRGEFDMMILLTGVGARLLGEVIGMRWPVEALAQALRTVTVVVRGPKPFAVCREWNVPVTLVAPEPNTWREILSVTQGRPEKRIAVQEYGRTSAELLAGLYARGAEVTAVPVYNWDLPDNVEPLREAVRRISNHEFDVLMLTTSVQVTHMLRIAGELGLEQAARGALSRMVVASVGPTTSETLADFGIKADFEPSRPKMGYLVTETAAAAAGILERKR
jgi:uroporphyrinogen-III synthase